MPGHDPQAVWFERIVIVLAIAVAVWVGWSAYVGWQRAQAIVDKLDPPQPFSPTHFLGGADPDVRFMFLGDPSAATRRQQVRSIVERYPDDPRFIAEYLVMCLRDDVDTEAGDVMTWIERGRAIEPDNAFYDFIEAHLWFAASCETDRRDGYSIATLDRHGEPREARVATLTITDEAAFARGMAAFERGTAKSYFRDHRVALLDHRMAQLPPAGSIAEQLQRGIYASDFLFEDLLPRWSLWGVIESRVMSIDLRDGLALAGRMDLAGIKMAATTDLYWTYASGVGAASQARWLRAARLNEAGRTDQGQAAFDAAVAMQDRYFVLWPGDIGMTWQYSLLPSLMMPGQRLGAARTDWPAWRRAEAVGVGQLALAMFVGCMVPVVLLHIVTGPWVVRRQHKDKPYAILFVGWRRLAAVLAITIIAPLAVYAVYLACLPWDVGGESFIAQIPRYIAEMLLLFAVMLFWLLVLSADAVRDRARERGFDTGSQPQWRSRMVRFVLMLTVIAGFITLLYLQRMIFNDPQPPWISVWLVIASLALCFITLIVWGFQQKVRTKADPLVAVVLRSVHPIVLAGVMLFGLLGQAGVNIHADVVLARLQAPRPSPHAPEIAALQQQLRHEHGALLAGER